ncbi:MAG: DUF3164 family protein [Magnetococcales bacterium]|nr:DUF3164 family protein [Magnetococcales bacterium]
MDQVRPLDALRDGVVKEIVQKAKDKREQLRRLKAAIVDEIAAFVSISLEKHGAKVGGEKGNVTLRSFDGKFKIQVDIAERMDFDEGLLAAKLLIDNCIRRWSEGARPEILTLVQDAFRVDSSGGVDVWRVLALKRLDYDDDEWKMAMDAINNSMYTKDSKQYIRFYEQRLDGKYEPIPLDFATL